MKAARLLLLLFNKRLMGGVTPLPPSRVSRITENFGINRLSENGLDRITE